MPIAPRSIVRRHPPAVRPSFFPVTARPAISRPAERWRRSARSGLVIGVLALSAIQTAVSAQADPVQSGRTAEAVPMADRWTTFIREASRRFGIPESWIQAVINAESAGIPTAVSAEGAMGLMQLMPPTWQDLRHRHALGQNAFDPRDNILAGTAYIRELYDRYGAPGFLAAYHAGPRRYEDYLTSGRTLPAETRAYLTTLKPALGTATQPSAGLGVDAMRLWAQSPLFVAPLVRARAVAQPSSQGPSTSPAKGRASEGPLFQPAADGLFVRPSAAAPR